MIILFKLIMLTSILVLGWKIVTAEGMALHGVFLWAEDQVNKGYKIFEWFVCAFCAPTLFTLPAFIFAYYLKIFTFHGWVMILYYPLCVAGSSIVAGFTWTMYEFISTIKEKNEIELYHQGVDEDSIYDNQHN